METALIIWAIGVLPNIGSFLVFIGLVLLVGIPLIGFPCLAEKAIKKGVLIKTGTVAICVLLIGGLIPDKSTLYAMVAGYGVQSVAENAKVQEVASDAGDVLASYLKKIKKELDEEAK